MESLILPYISCFIELNIKKERKRKVRGSSRGFAKTVASLTRLPMTTNVSDISYRRRISTSHKDTPTSTIDNKCTDNPLLNRIHPTSISYGAHRDPIRPLIHRIATSETLTEKARQKHLQSATKRAQLQRPKRIWLE
jgi:hypothetical protein